MSARRGRGWRDARVIFAKELRETLRDTRTLLIMVVVPVLLYPAILIASEQLALFGLRRLERDPAVVAVAGDVDSLFLDFVRTSGDLRVLDIEDPEDALRSDSVSAVAVFLYPSGGSENRSVSLLFDAADDRSRRGREVLTRALEEWGDSLLQARISEQGLPAGFARPLVVADSSVARPEELGGYALGRFLPMLLVVMTLLGAFYPAIDLAAGEKERGTLETLLTAPIPADQVVVGKFMTVTVVGLVAAGLNLGSMLLTFQTGLFQLGQVSLMEFSLSWTSILVIFATLFPLAVLFGALFLGIAVRSQSFKEAQNALTPVYMVMVLPALLPLFPGIEFGAVLALVPVAGVSLLFRELMAGNVDLVLGMMALLSTLVYASLALVFAAHSFGREEVLFGASGDMGEGKEKAGFLKGIWPAGANGDLPRPAQTLTFIALMGVLFFYGSIRLQVALGELGVLVTQVGLILIPALLFVFVGGFRASTTLSLRAPRIRDLVAGVLIICGATPLVWFLTWLQGFVLPVPQEFLEGMSDFLTANTPSRVLWLLLLVALTPAICEEILFRGILLSGIRGRVSFMTTVMVNGLIFGAFHVPGATVIRFLPTAILGMLLTWVVIRSRSIWTGMLMHLINNGSIVILTSSPWILERFSDPSQGPPPWLLLPAAASLLAGGFLLESRREGS